METYPSKTLDKLVEEQIGRWHSNRKRKYKKPIRPVITISRLSGCDAWNIAKQISADLEIDFFDQEIVDAIAKNADVNRRVVETVDEQDNSIVLDWLSTLTAERHFWPNVYLDQLTSNRDNWRPWTHRHLGQRRQLHSTEGDLSSCFGGCSSGIKDKKRKRGL